MQQQTMNAIVKYDNKPFCVEYRKVPVPVCGDDDVLIEVKAAGLCGSEIRMIKGDVTFELPVPVTLGHEFAGEIVQVGKNVSNFKVGDRVASDNTGYVCGHCWACATGQYFWCKERDMIGAGMDGGFAKYVKVGGPVLERYPNCLMKIPEGVTWEEASIMDPATNGYKAVIQDGQLMPGEDVVVIGVGAIGLCAIQAAKIGGAARIVAVDIVATPERIATAKAAGATDFVVTSETNLIDYINDMTDGDGVPLVINCAGPNSTVKDAIDICRRTGRVVLFGYDPNPYGYSLNDLMNKGIRLIGHSAYDYTSWSHVFNMIRAGKYDLKPVISCKMKMSQFMDAMQLVTEKKANKVILEYDE